MKGIILAGGLGTRLYPLTHSISKQLLPVYDKPVIYYPLSTLMLAGIRDILVISTPRDLPMIESLLGDGGRFGLRISYRKQDAPRGISEAFIIGEDFIGGDSVCLILGDNFFYGHDLTGLLKRHGDLKKGAVVCAYHVNDPSQYGIVEVDARRRPVRIVEKPKATKSSWAVTGLYFYDNKVVGIAKSLKPSARGELEITEVNNRYLTAGELSVEYLGRGFSWLDTGSPEALITAAQFVQTIEKRQGLKIACIEEIAFKMDYINEGQFGQLAEKYGNSDYGRYLRHVLEYGTEDV
ncbi:MAG: glucose-1-phosphate thymidylyltransferase [Bdellovibrionales bacterium RIFOXYD1_FULL_53_11]|nr:MAG: glucose-1-phosphate thymidylyltransferase [Bdellovibrionales bacterium RIFOXYD1_FULL_53_11]